MRIHDAAFTDGILHLKVDAGDAYKLLHSIKRGADYDITPAKKRRSLDANGLAWTLIHKIAEKVKLTPEEIYRNTVKELGGNCEMLCCKESSVEHLKRLWEARGLGWQVIVSDSKVPNCKTLAMFYGSSVFTVNEMSRFIDILMQDCHSLGIETRSQEEVNSLLEAWT